MAKLKIPTVEYLRERLIYDPETGKLFWRDCEAMPNKWRRKWAGKEAFQTKSHGYLQGKIDNVPIRAHRAILALHNGAWPAHFVDHLNGDRSDNRLCNLREVTPQENNLNMKMSARNTSGVSGVYLSKRHGKWRAYISFQGVQRHLGFFDCLDGAKQARSKAELELGFSERHGTLENNLRGVGQ